MTMNRAFKRKWINALKKSTHNRNKHSAGCFGKTRNIPKDGWDYEGNTKKIKVRDGNSK